MHLKDTGAWIEANLFPEDFLGPSVFEATEVLYRCAVPNPLLELVVFGGPQPAPFSQADVNAAIITACQASDFELNALWWAVNVHDNVARVVEQVAEYCFAYPLKPLFEQLTYRPAQEGGTSYAGLLDRRYRWALSLESENEFVMSVHGPASFCRRVATELGVQVNDEAA